MMPNMRLTDAAVRFGGTLVNPDCVFSMVSIDSRTTNEGDLFIAVSGDKFDAHKFIPSIANKISGAIVSTLDSSLGIPQWVVKDTTQALGDLARLRRDRFAGQVIAVTGSSGKTSVKEMIAAILRESVNVHATRGNLNNHIGVPLTLLDMDDQCDLAVIEMGASAAGEISYLCSIAQPDIALINNIQRAHIAGFGNIEAIAEAKSEIYSGLNANGVAILNLDESYSKDWLALIAERQCLSFSVKDSRADVFAKDIKELGNGCYSFILCVGQTGETAAVDQLIELSTPGIHSVSNALAATACALTAGATVTQIMNGLAKVKPVSGRLEAKIMGDDVLVIDDTYNANLISSLAALDYLKSFSGNGRRIFVFGDMFELGPTSHEQHRKIGKKCTELELDGVFTLGQNTIHTDSMINNGINHKHFESHDELIHSLKGIVHSGDKILFKGSRGMAMEKVIKGVFAD